MLARSDPHPNPTPVVRSFVPPVTTSKGYQKQRRYYASTSLCGSCLLNSGRWMEGHTAIIKLRERERGREGEPRTEGGEKKNFFVFPSARCPGNGREMSG